VAQMIKRSVSDKNINGTIKAGAKVVALNRTVPQTDEEKRHPKRNTRMLIAVCLGIVSMD